jgi:signal transduction histidine kinase
VILRWIPLSWVWTLWDLVLATAVATVAVQVGADSGAHLVLGIAMAVAIVFRRRAPLWVFLVVIALFVSRWVVEPGSPAPYDIAVVIALASVVSHAPRRRDWYLAALLTCAAWLALAVNETMVRYAGSGPSPSIAEYTVLLVMLGGAFLFALAIRLNREANVALAGRIAVADREREYLARLAVADERAVIARELHDIVAHSLAVMVAQADGASYAVDSDTAQAREAMRTVARTGRDAIDEMHGIVAVLRRGEPTGADTVDLQPIDLDRVSTVVDRARAAGLHVELQADGDLSTLSAAGGLTVLRILQESLTNVLRHAGSGAVVEVRLSVDGSCAALDVRDDGGGTAAPVGAPSNGGGNGLIGMRERVAVHGGEFTAGPRAGRGWRITATIPHGVAR